MTRRQYATRAAVARSNVRSPGEFLDAFENGKVVEDSLYRDEDDEDLNVSDDESDGGKYYRDTYQEPESRALHVSYPPEGIDGSTYKSGSHEHKIGRWPPVKNSESILNTTKHSLNFNIAAVLLFFLFFYARQQNNSSEAPNPFLLVPPFLYTVVPAKYRAAFSKLVPFHSTCAFHRPRSEGAMIVMAVYVVSLSFSAAGSSPLYAIFLLHIAALIKPRLYRQTEKLPVAAHSLAGYFWGLLAITTILFAYAPIQSFLPSKTGNVIVLVVAALMCENLLNTLECVGWSNREDDRKGPGSGRKRRSTSRSSEQQGLERRPSAMDVPFPSLRSRPYAIDDPTHPYRSGPVSRSVPFFFDRSAFTTIPTDDPDYPFYLEFEGGTRTWGESLGDTFFNYYNLLTKFLLETVDSFVSAHLRLIVLYVAWRALCWALGLVFNDDFRGFVEYDGGWVGGDLLYPWNWGVVMREVWGKIVGTALQWRDIVRGRM